MSFSLAEPSMTDQDWPTFAAAVRENFGAIVRGDAGVFTKLRVDVVGGAAPGAIGLQINNTHGTAADVVGLWFTNVGFFGQAIVGGILDSGGATASLGFFTGGATPTEKWRIDTNGALKGQVAATPIYERARTTPLGEWIAFTPTRTAATGTWTGGTTYCFYTLIGKTMLIRINIDSSTLSNATATIDIAIPGGFSSAGLSLNNYFTQPSYNGTAWAQSIAAAIGTTIRFYYGLFGGWNASSAVTLSADLAFEIQ